MAKGTTFIGLDTHKVAIQVAMLLPGAQTPVDLECMNEKAAVKRMVRKVLAKAPGGAIFCYEAGVCGYALYRWIHELGAECQVVAPSLIPRKPGERIKTNRRDARNLSLLLRAGLLTPIQPPNLEDEAVRDLSRAREDAHEDLVRSRHRLSKLLLRRGFAWEGGKKAWGTAHRGWLRAMTFEHRVDGLVRDEYLLAIEQIEERMKGLEERLEEESRDPRRAESVGALRCFRGIQTVTAMGLVSEFHSFARFDSPRGLMAFVGLIPSEYSSGDKHRRGEITKAGNSHARRLLIEAAWHYRHRPSLASVAKRRQGQPASVIAIADKAMTRLHRRYHRLTERGKPPSKAVVAVARELTGFIWAALRPLAA
jgi:transposase